MNFEFLDEAAVQARAAGAGQGGVVEGPQVQPGVRGVRGEGEEPQPEQD